MTHECTEERFLRDVADHKMIVIRDEGVNRHIRFKESSTNNQYFDLITWPGHLCYTGDMGTYVFQRTEDMFSFFRTDRDYNRQRGRRIAINPHYWTEKLIAVHGGRDGGKAMEYDEAQFRRVINQYRVDWMRGAKAEGLLDADGRRALWEAVDDEVFGALEDGGVDRALWAAHEFSYRDGDSTGSRDSWHFEELWEHRMKDYTFGMVWCLYALAWGIEQYDMAKQPAAEAVPA
ncbi:hypothetical protein GTP44_04075 [Duganella sp. FT50W]|uniref:Uncharacterized protein n=1 Tax=Duganella lactea TaxID=2692173 RepID=A0A6L8MHA9_9BURK|nr:hypothetical protein [Duganella lactea]MYM81136.1 hypothetical protein [Duganella lactea]